MTTAHQNDPQSTQFGYQTVTPDEKTQKVQDVFHSVALRYDLMNDLMSLGLHRLWKRYVVRLGRPRPGQSLLDIAAGTGDVSQRLYEKLNGQGRLVISDLNYSMLSLARDRLINHNQTRNVTYVQANAEALPFAPHTFDLITLAFGLRNVTQKDQALKCLHTVLKPGGKLLVLEFSQVTVPGIRSLVNRYCQQVLPGLGQLVTHDANSYRYLAESIERHPTQAELLTRFENAGFEHCGYQNLLGGLVAIHHGMKF